MQKQGLYKPALSGAEGRSVVGLHLFLLKCYPQMLCLILIFMRKLFTNTTLANVVGPPGVYTLLEGDDIRRAKAALDRRLFASKQAGS